MAPPMRVNSLFQSTTKTLKCSVSIFLLFTVCGTAIFARQQKSSPLPKEDEACLACHGQEGMKSGAGKDISIRPDKHAASAHAILSCKDCHSNIKDFPHATKRAKAECKTCHEQQSAATPKSIHGLLGEKACASCHGSVHEIQSAVATQPLWTPVSLPHEIPAPLPTVTTSNLRMTRRTTRKWVA